jgi:hypothetical protein
MYSLSCNRRSNWDLRTSQYPLHSTDICSEEPPASCANKPPSAGSVRTINRFDYGFGQDMLFTTSYKWLWFLFSSSWWLFSQKVAGSWSLLQRSKKLRILPPHPLHNSVLMFVCVHLMTQAPCCAYGDNQYFMLEINFDSYQLCFNTTIKNSAGGPLC